MKLAVIGVGLIGGSMARDLKTRMDKVTVFGIDQSEDNLNLAMQLGVIDQARNWDFLAEADVAILSVPVDAAADLASKVLDSIGDQTLVFDVGSTKNPICKAIEKHPRRGQFLASHPIAGTEFSGPQAAVLGLFDGRTNIVSEVEKTDFRHQEKAMEIFRTLGMRIRYMDPEEHDRHIAYVSHLSHIISFMLGKTVMEKEKHERNIFDMAGSGFESTVRLAKSSPAMWTPIFKQNKARVLETLDEYLANLTQFKTLLENDDYETLFAQMQQVNKIKDILNGIQSSHGK